MQKGILHNILLIALCAAGIIMLWYSFTSTARTSRGSMPHANDTGRIKEPEISTIRYNAHLIDTAISLLKSGDVLLRTGIGPDSYIFAQLNQKDKTYSHCGIMLVEQGQPWVYHSIGGEDNPDERLRRDPAAFFMSPVHNSGIAIVRFDMDTAHIARLAGVVSGYYRQRPRFDMKFNLATDSMLYCAEFVYKALNKAMADTGYIATTTLLGNTFVGVDNIFINPHARIVWQARYKY